MQKKFFFVCCKDSACCREWRSQKIKSFLENFKFKLQAPVFSKQRRGHNETFLHRSQLNDNFYGHDKQPILPIISLQVKDWKNSASGLVSPLPEKSYVKLRHKCAICGKAYASLTSLNRHKKKGNHTKRKAGVPQKSTSKPKKTSKSVGPPVKKSKAKQPTINDVLPRENQQEMMRIMLMKTRNVPLKVASSVPLQM